MWGRACSRWQWFSHMDVGPVGLIASKLCSHKGLVSITNSVVHTNPVWRGSLLPFGREAALKPDNAVCQAKVCCAAQRGHAPSPQETPVVWGRRYGRISQIGSASGRERVCQDVDISGVGGDLKKK